MTLHALFPDNIVQEALSKRETWDNTRNYWANYQWLEKNFDQVKDEYKGEVVIIVDQEVMFHGVDMEEVRLKLEELSVRASEAYLRYVPAENESLLL